MNARNVLSLLVQHATAQPNKIAIYVIDRTEITMIAEKISYYELWLEVQTLAGLLKTKTVVGDRVMLCYPTGIDYVVAFYACLWAQVIPVTVTAPSNAGLLKKFRAIHTDCSPRFVLTDTITLALLDNICQVMATDVLAKSEVLETDILPLPTIHPSDLAFLQYTSGSASSPKGVMVSHSNLIHNLDAMAQAFNSQKDWVGVNWLPHTHDMGLVGSFLHSVYKGAEIYLMSPSMIIRRPLSWLKAASYYRANITGGPCFMLQMCLDHWHEDHVKDLDLSAMKHIVVGSEPINESVVRDFFRALESKGLSPEAFTPAYGLAEATLMVSARRGLTMLSCANHSHPIMMLAVSCGTPYQNILVVSPDTGRLCLENETGEIWINGPSLAQGYWQNDEETKASFGARLNHGDATYFKTGDLGFLNRNELYVVGRIKEVIIINGVNYYPQDIECCVLASHEALRDASSVVFRWRQDERAVVDEFVVLVKSNKRGFGEDQETLITAIKKQILKTYHLVPFDVRFVPFGFPKTTSGKLQRYACASLYKDYCERHDTVPL